MNDEDFEKARDERIKAMGITREQYDTMAHDLPLESLVGLLEDLVKLMAKFEGVIKDSEKAVSEKAKNEYMVIEIRDVLKDVDVILNKYGPPNRPALKPVMLIKAVLNLKLAELSMVT